MFTKCLLDKILLIWYNIIKIRQGKVLKTRKVIIMEKVAKEIKMDTIDIVLENSEMLQTIKEELEYTQKKETVLDILAYIVDKLNEAN